jgi:hypothetical protein
MASEHSDGGWTWAAMEPEPTDQERQLYDMFCIEYLVDNNATAAASRCGFQAGFAAEYGKLFFSRSYVQRRLAELRRKEADTAADRTYDHSMSIATLRQIASDSAQKASARVAAVRQLAMIRGFNAPVKAQVDLNTRAGVMQVPAVASLDEWEAAATASQTALAEASRI